MGFKSAVLTVFAASVLLCSARWAHAYEITRVVVLVNDSVGVNAAVLKHAESEAGRLFHDAGIEVNWVDCRKTSDCRRPPRENEFVLHIVRNGKTHGDLVFGEAFLGADGRGKYADVFFDRVRQENHINIGQLLGAICAHELGHLLLGSHSHSLAGIMAPIWKKESLQRIAMGSLAFTPEQRRRMNGRLGNERVDVTSVGRLLP